MARAALQHSLTQLADASGVSEKTIRRCEAVCGYPPVSEQTLQRLQDTFERHGVRFIQAAGRRDGPGITLDWDPNLGELREEVLTAEELSQGAGI